MVLVTLGTIVYKRPVIKTFRCRGFASWESYTWRVEGVLLEVTTFESYGLVELSFDLDLILVFLLTTFTALDALGALDVRAGLRDPSTRVPALTALLTLTVLLTLTILLTLTVFLTLTVLLTLIALITFTTLDVLGGLNDHAGLTDPQCACPPSRRRVAGTSSLALIGPHHPSDPTELPLTLMPLPALTTLLTLCPHCLHRQYLLVALALAPALTAFLTLTAPNTIDSIG